MVASGTGECVCVCVCVCVCAHMYNDVHVCSLSDCCGNVLYMYLSSIMECLHESSSVH